MRRGAVRVVLVVVVALLGTGVLAAAAQSVDPPDAGQSARHDLSPPLRTIPSLPPVAEEHLAAAQARRETGHLHPGPQGVDPIRQSVVVTAPAAPAPSGNFDGVGNLDGLYPADPNGDVGPNHY